MSWIDDIILTAITSRVEGEPEIGINEASGNIALFDYQESCGQATHKVDICPMEGVNLNDLRNRLNGHGIAYVL